MENITDPLQGRVAVITGASSGIGEQIAWALAGRGAAVVLGARRQDRLESLAERIRANGGQVAVATTDVREPESVAGLVDVAMTRFGRLDTLINNAGVARLAPVDALDPEDSAAMIDVNVRGLLNGVTAAVPIFRAQGHGDVITIVSTAGIGSISPGMSVYAATKNAARTIMEGLRAESTDGAIRTTSISPGFVRTELADGMAPAARDQIQADMRAFGLDPAAVARAVCFVLEQPQDVEIGDLTIRPTVQG